SQDIHFGYPRCKEVTFVLVLAFHRTWQERGRNRTDGTQRLRCAPLVSLLPIIPLAPLGNRTGQLTMRSSRSSSGTSFSLAPTLPRTDTPAACTVSGSPETSGCHQ